MLNESVHDSAALKFVFLAGGPASGKNFVADDLFGIGKNLSFGASGMRVVSFDKIFEKMLEKKGLSKDLSKIPQAQRFDIMSDAPNSLRQQARKVMKKQLALYATAGLGIIFDGTGQVPWTYENRKREMEELGYDTHLIYVETPLKTALERNSKRERRLPQRMLARIYRSVKANKAQYQRIFGADMIVVDNSDKGGVTDELRNRINKIITSPVKNRVGQEFLQSGGVRKIKEKPKHKWSDYHRPSGVHSQADGFSDDGSYDDNYKDYFAKPKSDGKPFAHTRTFSDPFSDPYGDAIPWWNMNKKSDKDKSSNSDQFDLYKAMGRNPDPLEYTPRPLPTMKGALRGDNPGDDDDYYGMYEKERHGDGLKGAEKPPKTRNAAKTAPQGAPIAQKPRGTPLAPKTPNPKVHKDPSNSLEKRIRNPETGNDILVTTALGYPPDHPMRKAAERYLKK